MTLLIQKELIMPWNNGDYPQSYKNQPEKLRQKAVEIANALLEEGIEDGIAIIQNFTFCSFKKFLD